MSTLQLYILFKETTTLSNNIALLCKATLMTFASYSSGGAVTWCTANVDTFAARSFSQQSQLISYVVTTPIVSTDTSSLTAANIALFSSTLWDNGFFTKETSLAAVVDVENAANNHVLYAILIGLYTIFNMLLVLFLYYMFKGKFGEMESCCVNPCLDEEGYEQTEPTRSDCFCYTYKRSILHALYMILNFAMIGAYCIIVILDNNYIELKTPITVLEHLPISNVAVFRAFLF